MKLQFYHKGRQFFFITLALEGRPQALSHLIEGAAAPKLSAAGETVLAFLLAMHQVFPCLTISNRVIMPDHIHFLMIVNYECAPTFNPLRTSFLLMDAIEAAWSRKEGVYGPSPTPDAVAQLTAIVAKGHEKSGGTDPVRSELRFERRAYIELSFNAHQLKTIRAYIKLNPARALWKQKYPNRFVRFSGIRHAVLAPEQTWDAMGNLTLLGSPFLFHVRLTLKKSVAEHEEAICEIIEQAKRGMIPVGGFISPGEVEALRRLKATPGTRFIKLLPCSLPPCYDPSAEDSRELAADRLLILSGFRNTQHISALAMRRDPAQAHLFRANCLAMNDLCATLCARARLH